MELFVIGTGRSGTHWVGHIIEEHPDVRATIETWPVFPLATRAALQPRTRWLTLPALRAAYVIEARRSRPRHYMDKSHPALWFAESVAKWFPSSRFVGLQREPYAVVSSMLDHSGVRAWQEDWRKFGVPNPFLGISESNAEEYVSLSPAQRAAHRWKSHHERMGALAQVLGDRLKVLEYELMLQDFDAQVRDLWEFLRLPRFTSSCRPNAGATSDWRSRLDDQQVAAIAEITGRFPR